jgi:phosphonoacetaldehyde hydrolase
MENNRRVYHGPLQAVILDWAGTTVDYGCMAPAAVFIETFWQRGVAVTMAQARAPMGMFKLDHIRAIAQMEPIAIQWQAVHGHACSEADVEAMYHDFLPLQLAVIAQYADVIPGTLEALAAFRQRGLKIGSTTGYTRAIMDQLAPLAAQRGYLPDAIVCADEVPAGRPQPWMMFQNALQLKVYPMAAIVKIGDTVPDIEEGLNAGAWTIGLVKTGNEIGLTETDVNALDPSTLKARLEAGYARLDQAGAHYVVDGLADVVSVLEDIEARLAQGEGP